MVSRTLIRTNGHIAADPVTVFVPSKAKAPSVRRLVGEQIAVLAGQGISGLGNFAFLLVALRWLPAQSFAALATFMALYLLVQLPANGLSAGSSMLAGARTRRTPVVAGLAGGVALAAAAHWLAAPLHLPVALLVLLAASLVATPKLALCRGRLYGETRPVAVAGTLVIEPAVRLTAGLALLSAFGVVGGAVGVVLGGYGALLLSWRLTRRRSEGMESTSPAPARMPWPAVVGFLGFAIVQNQDLVFANGLLTPSKAGMFAALSTLGGIAAFATANIPLVLLPRTGGDASRARHATAVALGLAAAIGAALVIAVAVVPESALAALVGERYVGIAGIAVLYLAAMALLGVARVLGARLLALGRGPLVTVVVAAAVALQAGGIWVAPRTVRGVAVATFIAVLAMTAAFAIATVGLVRTPTRRLSRLALTSWVQRMSWPAVALVTALTGVGVAVRLFITRGLWLDEATSVMQARMPFGQMLHALETTDVHPPGYFAILWGWVRIFGTGPLSVRMPSIIIGAAVVPVLYCMGRDLYGKRTGLVAAVFGVVAPQLVWYSQEARMYGLFILLATLSVWAQLRALRDNSSKAWVAHGALCAALMWTQYFTVFVVLVQQLATLMVFLARRRRRVPVRADLVKWLAAMTVFVVLVAPLVPFVLHQYDANQAAGRGFGAGANRARQVTQPGSGLSPYVVLANLLWAVWGYHSTKVMTALGALWPAGMLLALGLLGRGRSRSTQLVLAVAILPIAAMFALGEEKRFLFDLRYFIACVPLLLLATARAVTSWPRSRVGVAVLATAVSGTLVAGLADQQFNGDNPRRYDFQPALTQIGAAAGPDDKVVLAPAYLRPLVSYYQPALHSVDQRAMAGTTVRLTENAHHVFVLGSFFDVGGERAQIVALLHHLDRTRERLHTWRFANVRVWEYG
jgi:4-amino-4-deoxy-L-arabinose transferase-like glycosyltransferase/O-antigen/teichoic acid export membrane protein